MKNRFSRTMRQVMALVLAAALTLTPAMAAAGTQKLQTKTTLMEGLSYINTVSENLSNRIESFAFELTPGSPVSAIMMQGSGTLYGGANITRAVTQAQKLGYTVLGAVNTDFFDTSSGVPIGISIEDGVYKSDPGGEPAVTVDASGNFSLVETPAVNLQLTNMRTAEVVVPNFLNKVRTDKWGINLFNQDYSTVNTHTGTEGWYVRMKIVVPEGADPATANTKLTVNSTIDLEVVETVESSTEPMNLAEGEYVLTSATPTGNIGTFQKFQTGDIVTLTTSCSDPALSAAQWAGGVGDVMVRSSAVTDSSTWDFQSGRAPRTAMGVKADGTMLIYAVDGRNTGYSSGLTEMDLAEEMLARGCVWAVNLDGGGSTALSAWLPGRTGPMIKNIPSDGSPRSCATYMLFVTRDPGDGKVNRLALVDDGQVVLAGSSMPLPDVVALDSGMNAVSLAADGYRITNSGEMGTIADGLYHAGTNPGTDTLFLEAADGSGVWGEGQVNIVDSLTGLSITREGSTDTLSGMTLKPGETVQLAVTGDYWSRPAHCDWSSVTWTFDGNSGTVDEQGLYTAPAKDGTGTITATAGGQSQTIRITVGSTFSDVPDSHWAHDAVEYCYSNGIVQGIGDGKFGVGDRIQRCDFVLMLYNTMKKPAYKEGAKFNDVSSNQYFYDGVSWGAEAGIIQGSTDGNFSPRGKLTREQAFTILGRSLEMLNIKAAVGNIANLQKFSDYKDIASYAVGFAATLVDAGLVQGSGDELNPKNEMTRGEMAQMLANALTSELVQEPGPEDPGTDNPGEEPGGENPGEDPGTENPGEEPGGENPGEDPGTENPGEEPGGENPSEDPGTENPGDEPGEDPGTDKPGEDPGEDPGTKYTITINKEDITLESGKSATLVATVDPVPEKGEVKWSSDNPQLAAVNEKGVVTNLSTKGSTVSAHITASFGSEKAECVVRCKPASKVGIISETNGQRLNVRVGPGTTYKIVGSLNPNSEVIITKETDGWYYVQYLSEDKQAAVGYVSGEYVTIKNVKK